VYIALPTVGVEFDAGDIILNWVMNGFILTAAILSLPFGRVCNIHGKNKILYMEY
jgi:MFS family permease